MGVAAGGASNPDLREDIEVAGVPIIQYGNKRKTSASKEEEGAASRAAGTVFVSWMGEGA